MRVVMVNGCFDILHIGHLQHLEAAKQFGDWLLVALTLDEFVNKGPDRPVHKWTDRAELLQGLRVVDAVVPSRSCHEAIRTYKPHIFAKGMDYEDSPLMEEARRACEEIGAKLLFTQTPKRSSSALVPYVC